MSKTKKVIRAILIIGWVLTFLGLLARVNRLTLCPDCHKHRKGFGAERCASCEEARDEKLKEMTAQVFKQYLSEHFDEDGNFILGEEEIKTVLKYDADTYLFLPEDVVFYSVVSNNPIEKEFSFDGETTGDNLDEIFANKKLWDNQIEYSMKRLEEIMDADSYAKLVEAHDSWTKYADTFLKTDQHLFYYGCVAGSSVGTVKTAMIARERSEQFAITLLSLEYELTGSCTFNAEFDMKYEYTGDVYSYMNLSIYDVNDGLEIIEERNGFKKTDISALQNGINSEASTVSQWVQEKEAEDMLEAVNSYYKYIDLMEEIEISSAPVKSSRISDIKVHRLRNLYAELTGMNLSLN